MLTEDKIARLKELKILLDQGILTPEEMEQEKKKILASELPASPDSIQIQEKDYSTTEKKKRIPLFGILGGCLLVAIIVLLALLLNKGKTVKTSESQVPSLTNGIAETKKEQEQKEIISLVNHWCEGLSGNLSILPEVYGPQVLFYQTEYSRERVLETKQKAIAKAGYFAQSASDFRFDERPDGTYRVNFTKQTVSGQSSDSYPAYVSVQKIGGAWKIVEESDLITDKNLAKKRLAKMTLINENSRYGYYTEIIKRGIDEFDLDEKKLYQYDKQSYEIKYLLTCGDEMATKLLPIKSGAERVEIFAIDDISFISPSRILISGCPDMRNNYAFVFDTESNQCAYIDADMGVSEVRTENGRDVIVAMERKYGDDGPELQEKIYDMDGQFLHYGKNLGSLYDD